MLIISIAMENQCILNNGQQLLSMLVSLIKLSFPQESCAWGTSTSLTSLPRLWVWCVWWGKKPRSSARPKHFNHWKLDVHTGATVFLACDQYFCFPLSSQTRSCPFFWDFIDFNETDLMYSTWMENWISWNLNPLTTYVCSIIKTL